MFSGFYYVDSLGYRIRLKYSIVSFRPSSKAIVGSHFSFSLAKEISGFL